MLNDNIQNVDLAQQPPQDSSVLTIDEIRQANNQVTSSTKASTICMFSTVCLTMSAIGTGCLASGHPLEGAILTGIASGIGIPCVKNLFDYLNVLLSNQRINARENQAIEAHRDSVRQNNDARENQAIVAPQGTVNAMDRPRDSINNFAQVNQLSGDIVFRQR